MSCKLEDRRPDWKSYALGELDARARQEAESHVAACADCQDELAGLRLTLDAMATLRDEELPRRIAFVSDKVFEPRWYQKLFLRPSFAAAGLIAAAIGKLGMMLLSRRGPRRTSSKVAAGFTPGGSRCPALMSSTIPWCSTNSR